MPLAASPRREGKARIRFLDLDALGRQPEGEDPTIAHDAEVGGARDGDARVVVWRVLHGIGIVPLRAELKHCSHSAGWGAPETGRIDNRTVMI